MRNADFLGKGWGYPVKLDKRGRVHAASDKDSVQQSVWIILSTAPGERVMRPDFGCDLHQFVFANNDSRTVAQAAQKVREALIRWEPRIDVLDVTAEVKGDGEILLLNISYRLRSTNNLFNLVYPFYLMVETP